MPRKDSDGGQPRPLRSERPKLLLCKCCHEVRDPKCCPTHLLRFPNTFSRVDNNRKPTKIYVRDTLAIVYTPRSPCSSFNITKFE